VRMMEFLLSPSVIIGAAGYDTNTFDKIMSHCLKAQSRVLEVPSLAEKLKSLVMYDIIFSSINCRDDSIFRRHDAGLCRTDRV
jgi:hypothetical protein